MREIELWSDSFHEGDWACEHLYKLHLKKKLKAKRYYENGFVPVYQFFFSEEVLQIKVYGSYKSWSPVPKEITKLIVWGKPDFLAYDPISKNILFAVEETAAVPTGNQALQRCERLYGASRLGVPFWYLLAEFGTHKDKGIRTDSIWPTVMSIKLSIKNSTPSVVLHYSNKENPEGYDFGKGVSELFNGLYQIVSNFTEKKENLNGMKNILFEHYKDMFRFIKSQYANIIDNLPGIDFLNNKETINDLVNLTIEKKVKNIQEFKNKYPLFLIWPDVKKWLSITDKITLSSKIIKYDKFAENLELSINKKLSYVISSNAGSKPQKKTNVNDWIRKQNQSFDKSAKSLNIDAKLDLKLSDFPKSKKGNLHLTTAKNILYLFDQFSDVKEIIYSVFPRLNNFLENYDNQKKTLVYLSNSLKPGRIFGDPFTGQISCYSTVFGKFDHDSRLIISYFPHQSFSQIIDTKKNEVNNKGFTLMRELNDFIIFGGGVVVKFDSSGRAVAI